jgi:hypothetical protein
MKKEHRIEIKSRKNRPSIQCEITALLESEANLQSFEFLKQKIETQKISELIATT